MKETKKCNNITYWQQMRYIFYKLILDYIDRYMLYCSRRGDKGALM